MKIGTLIFDIYAELNFREDVKPFILTMEQLFQTVSDQYETDYKVFADFAASIRFIVPLREFWKTDTIFNTLRKQLYKDFVFWRFKITLTIKETRPIIPTDDFIT